MMASLANHLWQSTLVAALAWLVTLALRRDRAGLRYGVWLIASLKFLIPFSGLTLLGAPVGWRPIVVASLTRYDLMVDVSGGAIARQAVRIMPGQVGAMSALHRAAGVLPAVLIGLWALGVVGLAVVWCARWRRVAAMVRSARRLHDGSVFESLRRLEARVGIRRPIALASSQGPLEPGVFGILMPTLVWPARIEAQLSAEQIDAILAHEVTHVRRRDNLAAAAHMVVQAAFWFHPVVWWLGSRLIEERELACDEAVVRLLGHDREAYAESILKTCRFFVESPLVCVAGVTGSNLRKRIEHIMTADVQHALAGWKKCLLAAAAALGIAGPVSLGIVRVQPLLAQQIAIASNAAFDVTLVKPNNTGSGMISMMPAANGGFQATNVTLGFLVRTAYQLQDSQIVGGPSWLFQDRFDVVGSGSALGKDGPPLEKFKSLLADRFRLVMHVEKRELPMYALVLANADGKLGENLARSSVDCAAEGAAGRGRGQPPPPPAPGQAPRCGIGLGLGSLAIGGQPMASVATQLSRAVGRIVVDRTNLPGAYNLTLTYAPDPGLGGRGDLPPLLNGAPPPAFTDRPSIFAALQEQLGLKLESTKGPVDVLVIDSAERPTEN